ncbi:hypothetical protein [Adhaeribacter soli]|uniref:DUF4907 domain-containing protein n=1 Tax=Adhaeribacter soli TaxID=2607655 RepID=A0A5N1J119_9BACT|nr:hypothetical protein [Adhaeribacter soli]KAA9340098.1 hypothetical protein F0P94_07035 [Adhaeribacter soli]
MKSLKKLALLGLVAPLLFSLLSFTNAVGGEGSVVTIKVYEAHKDFSKYKARILIAEGDMVKEISLVNGFDSPESNKNLETISNLLNQYTKSGYTIGNITAVPISMNNTYNVTTYILTK